MTSQNTASLIYLGLLLLVLVGSFVVANRANLSKVMQSAALWGLIFLGTIAAIGLWGDIRTQIIPSQRALSESVIEVPRAPDRHFYLTLQIDGTPVRFVVDTGATEIMLSRRDAERVGIDLDGLAYLGRAQTANGPVRTSRVVLDEVALGPIVDRSVPVWVNEGEMSGSLLGMAYLGRFASVELTPDKLVLTR
ncbi:aspartyl protease family protein [Poseidonocella pacifica]|uniref:Aspartyl protease family protein n=1 Tax=Poseidonocella pacifica TaxID=871651 RepID=A0A1I0VAV2_9RHOB|nr:TIGR02281 family clan AA aspartic protease [Poseidonocella pacifica]SFA73372.1 aspartyl protease family protein [Poseidonocella pacifica]